MFNPISEVWSTIKTWRESICLCDPYGMDERIKMCINITIYFQTEISLMPLAMTTFQITFHKCMCKECLFKDIWSPRFYFLWNTSSVLWVFGVDVVIFLSLNWQCIQMKKLLWNFWNIEHTENSLPAKTFPFILMGRTLHMYISRPLPSTDE